MKKVLLVFTLFIFILLVSAQDSLQDCIDSLDAQYLEPNIFNLSFGEKSYISGTLFIGFKENVSEQQINKVLDLHNLSREFYFGSESSGFNYRLFVVNGTEFQWACTFQNSSLVKYAEPNTLISGTGDTVCSSEGEMCGGISGIACCENLTCDLEGDYPDASGTCVSEEEFVCDDLCGDGTCQETVCQGQGCSCAETIESCPSDCQIESDEGGFSLLTWFIILVVLVFLVMLGLKIAKWLFWSAIIAAILLVVLYIFYLS